MKLRVCRLCSVLLTAIVLGVGTVHGSSVVQDDFSTAGSAATWSPGGPGLLYSFPGFYWSTVSSTQTVDGVAGLPFNQRILTTTVMDTSSVTGVNTASAVIASSALTLSVNQTTASSVGAGVSYQNANQATWENLSTAEPYMWIKFGNISWTGTGAGSNLPIVLWSRITNAVGVIENFAWNGDISTNHSWTTLTIAAAANNTIYFPLGNFSNGQTNNLPAPNGHDYWLTDSNFVQNVRQLEVSIFGVTAGQQASIEILDLGLGVIPEPSTLGLVACGVGLLFLGRRWIGQRR